MKESGQDTVLAKIAHYGAKAARSGRLKRGRTPVEPAPVHHNVESPFKPLAPFVPEDYWAALERRMAPPAPGRLAGWAAAIDRAARLALRRIAPRTTGQGGPEQEGPAHQGPACRKDRETE